MVWGGIPIEGRSYLYRLDNGTLTALRYRDEILGHIVRPYAGAVGPGFLLEHDNGWPHVARVSRQFLEHEGIDTTEWPPRSPYLNPIEHLWNIMFRSIRCCQVAPQTVQNLSDALVQIWEEIPQNTIRWFIRSMPWHYQSCIQARLPYKLLSTILSCFSEISAKWTSLLHNFFTLISGVYLNSALCSLIIVISIKRCGILSFLTHCPVHHSIDIQHAIIPHWDLMYFHIKGFL